jgi:hypothetical protein
MSGSDKNADLFHRTWKVLSSRANDAHHDYRIARDIAKVVTKPKVPDFPGSKELIRVRTQMEMYNIVQQRVRYYRERWASLDRSANAAFTAWIDIVGGDE